MSIVSIAKGVARGVAVVPPSKSYAHRLLLAAFLSGKNVAIDNVDPSNDILATMDCIAALGGKVNLIGRIASVECGTAAGDAVLPCRESGSTLRFMIPVALALRCKAHMTGTAKLFSRGLGEYEKIFASQGISYTLTEDSLVAEGRLHSGLYQIDGGISSQYITGLLFALPLLEGDSEIWITPPVQSRPYIEITIDVLRMAGIKVDTSGNHLFISGGQQYNLPDCSVEGDWSNAAFLDIYNHIGGDVTLLGLKPHSLQGDKRYRRLFSQLEKGWCEINLGNCIDLGPVLFTLAAIKHGARFINTARLRIKESDRVADILCELEKAGVTATVSDNAVEIRPIPKQRRASLEKENILYDSHNDHRLAMSLAALATISGARLQGAESIAKSYPGFFNELKRLGIEIKYE